MAILGPKKGASWLSLILLGVGYFVGDWNRFFKKAFGISLTGEKASDAPVTLNGGGGAGGAGGAGGGALSFGSLVGEL